MPARLNINLKGGTLSRDITLVVAMKALLLLVLWLAFFSHPSPPAASGVATAVLGSADSAVLAQGTSKP